MSARCANSQVDTNLIWQFQACKNPAAMSFAVVISKMRSEHNSVSKLSILASNVPNRVLFDQEKAYDRFIQVT
jgi:hypothetical protein